MQPKPTDSPPRKTPRRLLWPILLILAAAIAPVPLLSQRATRLFQVGPSLLSVSDATVGPGSRYGPIPVRRGHHYQIELQGTGTPPFVIHLDGQDGSSGKRFPPQLSFDEAVREMNPMVRAPRDDPAATLAVEIAPGADSAPLRLRRLEIHEVRGVYYVWRAAVRIGALLTVSAGLFLLGRRTYLHWASQTGGLGPRAARRAAVCAAVLMTLAGGCGVFIAQDQHARLFRQPLRPSLIGWDGSFYYFWLRSAMVEGDVDFAKDLRYCNSLPLELRENTLRTARRTPLGLIPNKYPIGWALFELPWYVGADATARVVNALGGEIHRDGWGPLYQAFLVAGQLFYAGAGLMLAYRVLSALLPPVFAASGVALGWLCSPLAYYQTLGVSMAHNVMFLAVVGAYLAALRLRADPGRVRWWVLVGVCCAMAILSRYQGGVMLLFPGMVCLQEVWRTPRRWTHLAAGIAASAVPLAVQAFAWKQLYGSFLLYTYEGEGFDWLHPHLWEVLFSPYHGWFNWHPALLAGLAGFAAWAVRTPRRADAACFAASLGLMIYVNGAWDCWWFGASFGGRAFEGCTLFAMLGFGWGLRALAPRPTAFHAAAAALLLAALWSMNLLWLSSDGPLALNRPISWREKIELTGRYWLGGK